MVRPSSSGLPPIGTGVKSVTTTVVVRRDVA